MKKYAPYRLCEEGLFDVDYSDTCRQNESCFSQDKDSFSQEHFQPLLKDVTLPRNVFVYPGCTHVMYIFIITYNMSCCSTEILWMNLKLWKSVNFEHSQNIMLLLVDPIEKKTWWGIRSWSQPQAELKSTSVQTYKEVCSTISKDLWLVKVIHTLSSIYAQDPITVFCSVVCDSALNVSIVAWSAVI